MLRLAWVPAVLVAIGTGDALACDVPYISTPYGVTVDGSMTVRSVKRCSIITRSVGPTFDVRILQRPSNGTVSTSGYRIIYVSKPGYVGRDSFTYERHGQYQSGKAGVRTVRVAVTVTR